MEQKKKCYLSDGTKKTGKRIIAELLKVEGATNESNLEGINTSLYYYLDETNNIKCKSFIPKGYDLPELPKELPRWVMVNDKKRLLVHDFGEKCLNRYIYVADGCDENYLSGKKWN